MSTPEEWCDPNASDGGDNDGILPPDRRITQDHGVTVSALCTLGLQPLMITGLLRQELIGHFGWLSQVEASDLRSFIWKPGDDTGILIESVFRWRGGVVEKHPAVMIKRNAYRLMSLSVGNRMGVDERGMERFGVVWVGSHTLFCIHGKGAAAEILATEVQREVSRFGPALVEDLSYLLRWRVTDVGAISELEESRESFVVPVTVGWAYWDAWTLERETLKLRKVQVKIASEEDVLLSETS